jgi:hypothetical protein
MPLQIAVRVGPTLKAWLDARAVQEEMSVSTLIRQWIQEHARQDLKHSEVVGDGDLRTSND